MSDVYKKTATFYVKLLMFSPLSSSLVWNRVIHIFWKSQTFEYTVILHNCTRTLYTQRMGMTLSSMISWSVQVLGLYSHASSQKINN